MEVEAVLENYYLLTRLFLKSQGMDTVAHIFNLDLGLIILAQSICSFKPSSHLTSTFAFASKFKNGNLFSRVCLSVCGELLYNAPVLPPPTHGFTIERRFVLPISLVRFNRTLTG